MATFQLTKRKQSARYLYHYKTGAKVIYNSKIIT